MIQANMAHRRILLAALVGLFAGPVVKGQVVQDSVPELMEIDIIEHLGDSLPLNLSFVDDNGSEVTLSDYFIYKKEQMYQEMVLEPENPQLVELRARENRVLNSYGLADSAAGEYHIPIDSAMKQVAATAGGNN